MKNFTAYFDNSIKEQIDRVELHNLVVQIRGMSLEELEKYKNDLITETRIDPGFKNTKTFRVAAKTAIRRIQEARNRGEKLVKREPVTVGQVAMAALGGIIAGEIASDLWSGSDGKGGIRQHLR